MSLETDVEVLLMKDCAYKLKTGCEVRYESGIGISMHIQFYSVDTIMDMDINQKVELISKFVQN